MSSPTPPSHPSPTPPQPTLHIPQFPLAGQPDMIRSVQKDEYYTQVLFDYLKEVSIWLIGMRNVMRFERELHTISRLLYYILTMFPISFPSSFSSLSSSSSSRDRNHDQQHRPYQYRQTLGEEYCDLVQFISHHQPSKPQSSQSASSQQKPTMAARQNSFISLSTFSHRSLFIILHVLVPHFWHMKSVQSWFNRQLNQLLSLVPFSHHQNKKKKWNGDNSQQQQQRQSDSDDNTAAQKLMIDFSKLVPLVLQLHLAIFYMSGQYLSLSKRFARIRYMFTGSPGQVERPTYRILGLLIFIQLFVSLWMYVSRLRREKRLKQLIRDHDENDDNELLGEGDHRENQRRRRSRGRTVSKRVIEHEILNDESWQSSNGSNTTSSSASGGADSQMNRCSLCLDKRRQTTATACGHLFCWSCIAECCTNAAVSNTGSSSSGGGSVSKCPICRQDISLQTLTRVYHFDHSDMR